jgi:hypothetical protein
VRWRRSAAGLYAVTHGLLRFLVARSEDDASQWELVPRSPGAWEALGEPDRAPHYPTRREALAVVAELPADPDEQRRRFNAR